MQPEIILYCIKLILGGIAAFWAIMIWSKTREAVWVLLIAGTLTAYAGIVYDVLSEVGIGIAVQNSIPEIAGINIVKLAFAAVPQLFFTAAFILAFVRKKL